MKPASKKQAHPHVKGEKKRPHKRRDAFARPNRAPQQCARSKCGVLFHPARADQVFHSPACRKAASFEKKFVPVERLAWMSNRIQELEEQCKEFAKFVVSIAPILELNTHSAAWCGVCKTPQTSSGGILTTLGWFCYGCVLRIHRVADETRALRDNPLAKVETEQEA
jgi:hypothetical protein